MFQLFNKAAAIAKEQHQQKQRSQVREEQARTYKHNLPVEIPVDNSSNASLRSLVLSFDDGEQPTIVAGRFIQENQLDPSLLMRIAHYIHEYLTANE